MKQKSRVFLKLVVIFAILALSQSLFSQYYRKCKIFKEYSGKLISELK